MENYEAEKKKERKVMDHESRLREISNLLKLSNICIIGVPEDEREKGAEVLFKQIIAENLPHLWKDTHIKIQQAYRSPIKLNKS